jgi:hypothetical protein
MNELYHRRSRLGQECRPGPRRQFVWSGSFWRKLRRVRVPSFLPVSIDVWWRLELCASSHFWVRAIVKLGHDVRLIPSAHVKPFVLSGRRATGPMRRGGSRAESLSGSVRSRVVEPRARNLETWDRRRTARIPSYPWPDSVLQPVLASGQNQTEESGGSSAISRSSAARRGFEAFDSIH